MRTVLEAWSHYQKEDVCLLLFRENASWGDEGDLEEWEWAGRRDLERLWTRASPVAMGWTGR